MNTAIKKETIHLFSCINFPWKWEIMIPVKPKNIDFHWILLFILLFILPVILSLQFGAMFFLQSWSILLQNCKTYLYVFFNPLKQTTAKKMTLECKQDPKIMYYTNLCCKIIELSYTLDLFWNTSDANLDKSWNKHYLLRRLSGQMGLLVLP